VAVTVPPGVSEQELTRALAAFEAALGPDRVLTGDEALLALLVVSARALGLTATTSAGWPVRLRAATHGTRPPSRPGSRRLNGPTPRSAWGGGSRIPDVWRMPGSLYRRRSSRRTRGGPARTSRRHRNRRTRTSLRRFCGCHHTALQTAVFALSKQVPPGSPAARPTGS